jgi:hypothetical protein
MVVRAVPGPHTETLPPRRRRRRRRGRERRSLQRPHGRPSASAPPFAGSRERSRAVAPPADPRRSRSARSELSPQTAMWEGGFGCAVVQTEVMMTMIVVMVMVVVVMLILMVMLEVFVMMPILVLEVLVLLKWRRVEVELSRHL